MPVALRFAVLLPAALLAACADAPTTPAAVRSGALGASERPHALLDAGTAGEWRLLDGATTPALGGFLTATNARLQAAGAGYAVQRAEVLYASNSAAVRSAPHVVYASDRARLQSLRWVPADPRRAGRTTITYGSFLPAMGALTPAGGVVGAQTAIDAAAAAWNAVPCSGVRLQRTVLPGSVIPSARLALGAFLNAPGVVDVGVVGWVPASIFTAIFGAEAGPTVVGVTFTYGFVAKPGSKEFTDIDRNGKGDVAFTEVWFQNAPPRLSWTTEASTRFGATGYDARTVALHELGHALGLDHFGRLFENGSGDLQGAPFAVMNASLAFSQRTPAGTDVSALCTSFAGWPAR